MSGGGRTKHKMRCHYEVLGVERTADADDLKKAYRRLALRWHPDKNPDNVEESTRVFREIQQAYEVLNDPQERAWYDRHRDVILAGGEDEFVDDCLDLTQYLSPSAYSGFGDDENGFYAVYADVFRRIDDEEDAYREDVNDDDDPAPAFGDSQSDYADVVSRFYAYWQGFSTKKTFVWVEEYDTRRAPDRRTRRLMEAENRKMRDAARKRRNELVRTLVDFVRRRDRRVKAHAQAAREQEAERRRRAEEAQHEQRRERLRELENFQEAEWSSMAALQDQIKSVEAGMMAEFGGADSDGDDGEDQDTPFCVACEKVFASQAALLNHQRSKKHRENVALLRRQLQADDMLGEDGAEEGVAELLAELDVGDQVDAVQSQKKKSKKARKKKRQMAAAAADSSDDDVDDELLAAMEGRATSSVAEASRPTQQQEDVVLATGNDSVRVDTTDSAVGNERTQKPKSKTRKSGSTAQSTSEPHEAASLICGRCSRHFSSRNKLFAHIKETGHALPLQTDSGRTGSREGKTSAKKSKKKRGG